MSKILIFGITGSVGAYLSTDLASKGHQVVGVGSRESDNGFFAEKGIEYLQLDITQRDQFNRLEGHVFDAVVHLAGAMPSKMEGYNPHKYIDTIMTGTLNVLDFVKNQSIPKIIFTQTRADSNHLMGSERPVPSEIQRSFPMTGDHSIYTICKNAAVDLVEHYYQSFGIARFILRLPTIYAFHPDKYFYVNGKRKVKAYRYLMDLAANSSPIEIWGNPSLKKEITYVKDLVQIIEKAIDSHLDGGFYNVGCGVGVSLDEQIKGIIKVFSPKDNPSPIIYRPEMSDSRQFVHDISKTKKELNYIPAYNYLDLLKDFKEEMEINRFAKLWGNA
ncbi:NAD-dependent epimerase/dehydratase family protein [Arthrospiribacter ruber]|nr:NAD(P)-dependent oxidoreductase [Arthrospiribacter ruber]